MRLENGQSEESSQSIAPIPLPAQNAPEQMDDTPVPSPDKAAPDESVPKNVSQPGFGKWVVAGVVVLILIALLWFGPQVWQVAQDQAALQSWVASLGWWGPLALVALNAVQIVVAPIPGYVAQAVAGYLFGPVWGGVWASVGLLIGSTLAFWLARYYGRPLAGRLVGEERLTQWEHVTHSESSLLWSVLLLGPLGDLPYFLAGLARVSFTKIFVITLAIRVPSTFVVAAAGAGVMLLTWWQIATLLVVLLGLLLLFFRYQTQIVRWSDRLMHRRVVRNLPSDVNPS